jgi:UDP-N-acetyl-2-amino-2-deoxyglucuronate dehydrogenase
MPGIISLYKSLLTIIHHPSSIIRFHYFYPMYKFAIIGCGDIAALHAAQIAAIGKLELVCDTRKEKADSLAALYQAKACYEPEEVYKNEEIDIVCICTPNGLHAEHCIKSLQGGKHVLCESPLCLTKAAAWQIIETEKFCRRKLMVVNIVSENIQVSQVRRQIKEQTNGHLYHFDLNCISGVKAGDYAGWKGKYFPGGGALYTSFTNYVDMLVALFGEGESVAGSASNQSHQEEIEFEDQGQVNLVMKTGIPGKLSWSLQDTGNNQGSLTIAKLKQPVTLSQEVLGNIITPSTQNYKEVYDRLIELVKGNGASTALMESARAVELIEKIYKEVSLNPSLAN